MFERMNKYETDYAIFKTTSETFYSHRASADPGCGGSAVYPYAFSGNAEYGNFRKFLFRTAEYRRADGGGFASVGACAILGGYTCAVLSARIGRDIRMAIYEKSLKLSVFDFRQFGTASITTRTVSDINTIQMALSSTIQMILPVPIICVIALALCFYLDVQMGLILLRSRILHLR